MYGIHEQLRKVDRTARLVAQIHDELLIECAADKASLVLSLAEAVMVEAGTEIFGDDIQMIAEGGIGNSWGDAH
jgi:DNA polymerase-1